MARHDDDRDDDERPRRRRRPSDDEQEDSRVYTGDDRRLVCLILGILFMIAGMFIVLQNWNSSTVVAGVNNLGLMNDRLVGTLAGIAFLFPGLALLIISKK